MNRWLGAVLVMFPLLLAAAPEKVPAISRAKDGKLAYTQDEHGNRVPDFSYAGYHAGETTIPNVVVRFVVSPIAGDATALIQRALDAVAGMPADSNGFRGTVLLRPGKYLIGGQLRISASGVVLRGSGCGDDGTILIASGHDRRTLIVIAGIDDRKLGAPKPIKNEFVPVNGVKLTLDDASGFQPGQLVQVRRACTAEWIKTLGMNSLGDDRHIAGWKAGSRELAWDRAIASVQGNEVTLDAPITCAIDSAFGRGTVASVDWPGRIREVGVENLRCESAFDPSLPKDEAHSWIAISFDDVADGWVRQVITSHFVSSSVAVNEGSRRITVEDVKNLSPISEIAGWRRHAFYTTAQQVLFQRCFSQEGRHDFGIGFGAAGPNAFVQCWSRQALDTSGPLDSWIAGVLFDNVRIDGNALSFDNLRYKSGNAGWSAANCVLWQCHAPVVFCSSPPTAANWSFGTWGTFSGNAEWTSGNESINPLSLYYAQLSDRLGADVMKRAALLDIDSDASSSPTVDQAAEMIRASTQPAPTMEMWIDQAHTRNPIPLDAADAKDAATIHPAMPAPAPADHPIKIENGWIVRDGAVATGLRQECAWWRGSVRLTDSDQFSPCITRFVPGRIGPGLTDDLDQLVQDMLGSHRIALEHHYGLWYDRRNDDHERERRMDGDALPPFYELPFLRSGEGTAWDGLSKYDLTRYNPWHFDRLHEFARLCDQNGLVLVDEHFFQHNIIEAGAHWASCPWRSANNINNMGFPEPPPYAGDKRIFMAEQFYDVTNEHRAGIYRAYIRKCLDNLADRANVIHLTSGEFTGPLAFAQFWLDTVAQWDKETGKHVIVGLSATKDVQDAILADPERAKSVDVIDIQYWWYQLDGAPYAPQGGKNLAPRQWARVLKPRASSFAQVVRAVQEYRLKYPDKAVTYSADGAPNFGLAALMGGGSLAQMKTPLDATLLKALPAMKPRTLEGAPADQFALVGENDLLIYREGGDPVGAPTAGFDVKHIDGHLTWLRKKQ